MPSPRVTFQLHDEVSTYDEDDYTSAFTSASGRQSTAVSSGLYTSSSSSSSLSSPQRPSCLKKKPMETAVTEASFQRDNNNNTSDANNDSQEWRKHGRAFRARLIMQDEEHGGKSFVLRQNCNIQRYYGVAEKVAEQFLQVATRHQDTSSELWTESYLVGHRLVKFLSTVLPTHPQYFSNDPLLVDLRSHSQAQLVQLLQSLEQLAWKIDEDQYNDYILHDLTHNLQDTTLSSIESMESFEWTDTATTTTAQGLQQQRQQRQQQDVVSQTWDHHYATTGSQPQSATCRTREARLTIVPPDQGSHSSSKASSHASTKSTAALTDFSTVEWKEWRTKEDSRYSEEGSGLPLLPTTSSSPRTVWDEWETTEWETDPPNHEYKTDTPQNNENNNNNSILDESSLVTTTTQQRRQRALHHFKGCVRCLLE